MLSVALQETLSYDLKEVFSRIPDNVKLVSYSHIVLAELMSEANLDQKGLAELSGIKQQNISNYVLGKFSPREEDLRRLGRSLKVIFLSDWTDEEWEKETPRYLKQQGES